MEQAKIENEANLREHYAEPSQRVQLKTLHQLDKHCRNFIALSPFLCLGTASENSADVSPRGDSPGFVKVLDDHTLAIPDWPGNNRLDSLNNIVIHPQIGLLFLIPGFEETLRVNGTAQITVRAEVTSMWDVNGKHPKSAIIVTVKEAFLHCGKALIRSRLWKEDSKVDRTALPSLACMMKDQVKAEDSLEQMESDVAEAYITRLY